MFWKLYFCHLMQHTNTSKAFLKWIWILSSDLIHCKVHIIDYFLPKILHNLFLVTEINMFLFSLNSGINRLLCEIYCMFPVFYGWHMLLISSAYGWQIHKHVCRITKKNILLYGWGERLCLFGLRSEGMKFLKCLFVAEPGQDGLFFIWNETSSWHETTRYSCLSPFHSCLFSSSM